MANLLKNSESYKDQKVKVTGKITYIYEETASNGALTDIILDTPESTSYNDRVYVTYVGQVPYVKGDNIVVYGLVSGSYTYKSQEGYKITLPLIQAAIIEKS